MRLTLYEASTHERPDHNTGALPLVFTNGVGDLSRPTEFVNTEGLLDVAYGLNSL